MFKGETSSLFTNGNEMNIASRNKNYEIAAKYRDNIVLIRDIATLSIFPRIKV